MVARRRASRRTGTGAAGAARRAEGNGARPAAPLERQVRQRYQRQHEERPAQRQRRQPGLERAMRPEPISGEETYRGSGKLLGKAAIITGGDSGIGRAVAIAFAREGADVAIAYLDEHGDAEDTARLVRYAGRRSVAIAGDLGQEGICKKAVERAVRELGRLDILVNNAAEQHEQKRPEDISEEQLVRTFRTNLFSQFFMAKHALPHLREGASIINTASVAAFAGHKTLVDYASTKGAIVAFTRSLAMSLADRGIRVNAVAPGPIWTPLIPASFDERHVKKFGSSTLLGRAGQPAEVAPCYVFLASSDSSFMTGQTLHPNGGAWLGG